MVATRTFSLRPAEGLGDEPLVVANVATVQAIDVGGVDEGDPGRERGVDGRDRLPFVGAADDRHVHSAQADRADLGAIGTQLPLLHDASFGHHSPMPLPAAELIEYLVDLGGGLLSYGCPTHRLEALLGQIAALEGFRADAFAVPTGLFVTLYGPGLDQPLVRMARVAEWATDLERLALVDQIFNQVLAHKMTLAQGRRLLDVVEQKPPAWPPVVRTLSYAGASGASAIFFGGGQLEMVIAGFGGALLGILRAVLGSWPRAALLTDFIGALFAAALAWGATSIYPDLSREVLVLSLVVQLVPGMALTNGLAELAHKNLVSGAAKLMEAMIVFLSIVLGIAMVVALEHMLELKATIVPPHGQAALIPSIIAMIVGVGGFAIILSVPRNLLAPAMLAGAVGWIVTTLGLRYLPGSLAAFGAAFSVALFANGLARFLQRPAQIFLLPGLILLDPGSFGFISLEAFLRGEFLDGAAKGFEMFLTAGAIVTGLLFANVILPARKIL